MPFDIKLLVFVALSVCLCNFTYSFVIPNPGARADLVKCDSKQNTPHVSGVYYPPLDNTAQESKTSIQLTRVITCYEVIDKTKDKKGVAELLRGGIGSRSAMFLLKAEKGQPLSYTITIWSKKG